MKPILLALLIALSFSPALTAQTAIANGNMENWTGSGNTTEPQYWNSNMTGGGNAPTGGQTCFQETNNPHGGTYCARVKTGFFIITTVNGSLTTGKVEAPTTNKADGYIRTIPGDPNYSMSFTGRPDSLVFWYRYDSYSSDYPNVEARLHVGNAYAPETPSNNNHPDSTVNIIARAKWLSVPNYDVTTWARVSLPFIYVDSRTPQYILITTTSSGNQTGGTQNSTLWLDDFEAIYNPTIATGTISPLTYYVTASTGTSVSVPFTLAGTYNGGNTVTAQLSDASGSFAAPTVIGSVSTTTSGTINATIPAGTSAGAGYRIRVVSSNPVLTAGDNGADVSVVVVSSSVAPSTAQTLAANSNGVVLTVNEVPAATSREWKYSTISGSGYVSFSPSQTAISYTPNFAAADTYYLVAVSNFPGGLSVTSNEVVINVVTSAIAPASPQSILVGVNGNTLTVTETPSATSREWLYTTTSGFGYQSFAPPITGATTYIPNFAIAGNYYVICQSLINGVTVNSNEVLISVGNATITAGTVNGSPFLFSPSAPDATVSVPFTTSGTFNNGNVFTAQFSDANGSFANPINVGTLTATSSGTISATIPHNTPAGFGYRIRVISDNPVVLGSDNGVDLMVDQFNNYIIPATTQTIQHSTNGIVVNVLASQTSTHEWKYSNTGGSGYVSFTPAQTGSSYTPYFSLPGTYYMVAVSTNNYNDTTVSNEVRVDVTNGSTITTSAISGSPFLISPSMPAPVNVDFTSDVVFNVGNIFKAQLSDNNGSFANPVEIGTLVGATIGTISATIPVTSVGGNGYRIRVVSTDPAVTGSDNGNDLSVVPFEISIAPTDTQHVQQGQDGNAITIAETHPASRVWKYSELSGVGYIPFSPTETGNSLIPHFNQASTYYIIVESTNSANDNLTSPEVVVIVIPLSSVREMEIGWVKAYWRGNDLCLDLRSAELNTAVVELIDVQGKLVLKQALSSLEVNVVHTSLNSQLYILRITDGSQVYSAKILKP